MYTSCNCLATKWENVKTSSPSEVIFPIALYISWWFWCMTLLFCRYGELQGLNKQETADKYGSEQVHEWRRSYDIPPPNGESLEMCAERAVAYFTEHVGWSIFQIHHIINPVLGFMKWHFCCNVADWTPTGKWKKYNDCSPWELIEVHHYVSWQANIPRGGISNLLGSLAFFFCLFLLGNITNWNSSYQVISLELATGIPMLYIFKEGRYIRRGSPPAPTEATVYAYTKVCKFSKLCLKSFYLCLDVTFLFEKQLDESEAWKNPVDQLVNLLLREWLREIAFEHAKVIIRHNSWVTAQSWTSYSWLNKYEAV